MFICYIIDDVTTARMFDVTTSQKKTTLQDSSQNSKQNATGVRQCKGKCIL